MSPKQFYFEADTLALVRAEWQAYKDKNKISQKEFAKNVLGIRQSAFSQYLNDVERLNVGFLLNFAYGVGKPRLFEAKLKEANKRRMM